jgi:hypothetical protein
MRHVGFSLLHLKPDMAVICGFLSLSGLSGTIESQILQIFSDLNRSYIIDRFTMPFGSFAELAFFVLEKPSRREGFSRLGAFKAMGIV